MRLVVRLERWGTFLVAGKQYEVHRCDIFLITSTFLLFFTLIHQLMSNLDIHAFFHSSPFFNNIQFAKWWRQRVDPKLVKYVNNNLATFCQPSRDHILLVTVFALHFCTTSLFTLFYTAGHSL